LTEPVWYLPFFPLIFRYYSHPRDQHGQGAQEVGDDGVGDAALGGSVAASVDKIEAVYEALHDDDQALKDYDPKPDPVLLRADHKEAIWDVGHEIGDYYHLEVVVPCGKWEPKRPENQKLNHQRQHITPKIDGDVLRLEASLRPDFLGDDAGRVIVGAPCVVLLSGKGFADRDRSVETDYDSIIPC